ncbi:ubiquitin-associated domain-containing protein 2-like [Liolophura sinensis]|uniref:ubiquitin-associated domain-containing protein 2-like n=1 Tax=Liolophura sinensis TaxID=3198878 RepID=UPI0031585EDE
MLSPYTAGGFFKTPVSKVLVGSSILNYFLVSFPLQHYKHLFVYNPSLVVDEGQLWRLLTAKLVFLDMKDVLIGALIFYYLRIFERRFGSRKYCSYLLGSGLLASMLEILMIYGCKRFHLDLGNFPSGPLCFLYPLYIPYFCDIPRVALTHMWGIPVTGKSFTYILGLQIASGTVESGLLAFCGCMAGIFYRLNFLKIKSLVTIPEFCARICDKTIGRALVTPSPRVPANMGATIEIQRQQQLERLEQQMDWGQFQQQPWGLNIGRPQPRNVANGAGIFGQGNVRHRHNQNPSVGAEGGGSGVGVAGAAAGPPDSQVNMLMEMGFTRDKVLQALMVTNNDMNMATNVLLQES